MTRQLAAITRIVLLTLAWLAAPAWSAEALPALETQLPEQLDSDQLFQRLARIGAQYPAEDYTLAALAQSLGNDPEQAFAYVRDRIGYAPYAGMLRGAQGTLSGREGNHLDRALLLRELLRLQGFEARLVVGQVAARSAASLKQRLLGEGENQNDQYDAALGLLGLGDNALARLQAREMRDQQQLMAALGERIEQAAAGAGADIERQRHTWVQARVRGEWLDLDPTLRTAVAGQTLGYFEASIDAPAPAEMHTVTLELFAESLAPDGTLQRESLLRHTLVAAQAAPAQIFLTFAPDVGSSAFGAAALTRAAGEETRYRPTLMVDGEHSIGAMLPPIGQVKSEVQTFLFGGDDTVPVLTALQLKVTTRAPGNEMSRTRTLFDRVPAQDRGTDNYAIDRLLPLHLIGTTPSFLASVHQVVLSNGSADPHRLAADIAFGIDFFGRELLDPEQFKHSSLHELLWPIGARNLALALAAERLSVAALNDRADLHFFVGASRVYLMSIVPRTRADLATRDVEIDLLLDPVHWSAAPDVAPREVVARRVRYGVSQQALETTLSELAAVASGFDVSAVSSASTDMAAGLRIMNPTDAQSAAFTPALRADINSARTVLAAPDQQQTWWVFDANDGSLTARLAPGLGGSRLIHTPPRSTAAGGGMGDLARQPANAGNTYRLAGNNRLVREGAGAPSNDCSGGGTEYTLVMCNVSIKISMSTGMAYTIITGEVIATVVAIWLQLL